MSDVVKPRALPGEIGWLHDLVACAPDQHPDAVAFIEGVLARLDQHGPTITVKPLADYLDEIEEEALDIPAWTLVALQAHPDAPAHLREALREVAQLALAAHHILSDLQGQA